MDGSRKYHLEWGNPITREHTWYAMAHKWILAQKLWTPKTQSTDHIKLKNIQHQCVDSSFLLRRGEILTGDNIETNYWVETEEKPPRDCHTWGSIPYTMYKPRCYCGCREVQANRNLISVVSLQHWVELQCWTPQCCSSSNKATRPNNATPWAKDIQITQFHSLVPMWVYGDDI